MKRPDIADKVLTTIEDRKIAMRPRWYFTMLSSISIVGILVLTTLSIYLVNILTLTVRIQSNDRPMWGARQRLSDLLAQFPWWMAIVAVASIALLVWLLRQNSRFYRLGIGWTIAAVISISLVLGVLLSYTPINQFEIGQGQGSRNGQHFNHK